MKAVYYRFFKSFRRIEFKIFHVVYLCFIIQLIITSCANGITHEGEVQAPIDNDAAVGKYYEDVVKQFEKAGFKEVTTREIPDLITGWLTKEGEVESVSIDGDTDYDTGNWFYQGASVVVAYHTFPTKKEKNTSFENMDNNENIKIDNKDDSTVNTELTTNVSENTEESTAENTDQEVIDQEIIADDTKGKESDPIVVDYYNISNIKVGDYISVTGPARTICTSNGKIKLDGHDSGKYAHCGMEIIVKEPNSSYNSYTIQAYKVNPGEYEETFYSHVPADFSLKPSKVGDLSYSGCISTITGRVDKILISEELENFYGISLGADSVVEYLELYYD